MVGNVQKSEPDPDPTLRKEVARYIESMTIELRVMARGAGLDSLAYFLDMARLEAAAQIDRTRVTG